MKTRTFIGCISGAVLALTVALTPAHAASIDNLRCWQGPYTACWQPQDYAFPAMPVWNAQAGLVGDPTGVWALVNYPPPTVLADTTNWQPQFPDKSTMVWGQVKGDSLHRWAWVIQDTAFASSYERGPSVGGAYGELAATQDGINPTPVLPGYRT